MDLNPPEIAAHLPTQRFSFDSADQVEEVLNRQGIYQRVKQLGKGPCIAEILAVRVNGIEIITERYEGAVCLSCSVPENSIALIFTGGAEGQSRVNGSDVSDGGLVFLPPAVDLDFVSRGHPDSVSLVIPKDRFNSVVGSLCPDFDFPDAVIVVTAADARNAGLRAEIFAQLNKDAWYPERVTDLIDAAVTSASELRPAGPCIPGNAEYRRRVAKKAQEFIEARFMDPIQLEDICEACGTGIRTLQRAFRDYFGFTITEYIRSARLDKAFRALKVTNPGAARVADIAVEHGLTHLGRFSVMYKEQFGESPSSTLASC